MKRSIITLVFLLVLSAAYIQHTEGLFLYKRKQLKIAMPVANQLESQRIKRVYIYFDEGEPSFVKVRLIDSLENTEKEEYYDLGFEADTFVLRQRYPNLPSPTLPVINQQNARYEKLKTAS